MVTVRQVSSISTLPTRHGSPAFGKVSAARCDHFHVLHPCGQTGVLWPRFRGGLSRDITRTRLRFHALTQRGFIGCTTATPVCALLCLLIPGQLSWTGQDRPVTVRRRVVVVCARVCLQYMGLYCSVFDCQSPVSASNSHIFTNQPRRTEPASFDV